MRHSVHFTLHVKAWLQSIPFSKLTTSFARTMPVRSVQDIHYKWGNYKAFPDAASVGSIPAVLDGVFQVTRASALLRNAPDIDVVPGVVS
jgi:hypothetical protein